MVWRLIGSADVGPYDKEVEIGPITVPPADGVEVWIQQTSPPSCWKFGYGLLWADNQYGRFIGTIKVYGHPEGEAYRLGAGLSSSIGSGVLKFSPRMWNLRWLQASNERWQLDFYVDESDPLPADRYRSPGFIRRDGFTIPVVAVGNLGRLSF